MNDPLALPATRVPSHFREAQIHQEEIPGPSV